MENQPNRGQKKSKINPQPDSMETQLDGNRWPEFSSENRTKIKGIEGREDTGMN